MLTVTEKAAQYLQEALTHRQEDAPEALRIVHSEEGFQLTLDDPKDGDEVFERDGQSYLVVDAGVSEALADATIDVLETPQGASLTLTAASAPPPKAKPRSGTESQP